MLDKLVAWFSEPGTGAAPADDRGALKLAVAALLAEAAGMDADFDEAERAAIARLLERRFGLDAAAARQLMAEGEKAAGEAVQLFGFARTVNERLDAAQRLELVEMLWEVAYADGRLDKHEDSLLRRIGGLVHVPDAERGAARRRVMQRLGMAEDL